MVGATVGISQHVMPTDLKPVRSKIRQNLPAVAYRAKPLGISLCDGREMPTVGPRGFARYATAGRFWRIFFCAVRDMTTVAPTNVRMATVRELEAES
jgi:hypothetical protein